MNNATARGDCVKDPNRIYISLYRRQYEESTLNLWQECGLLRSWGQSLEDIERCILAPSSGLMLASLDREIVGSIMLGHDSYKGWVYYLAVIPRFQRRGIGGSLMKYAESWMRERKISKLQASIGDNNMFVHAFYRNLGYRSWSLNLVEKIIQ